MYDRSILLAQADPGLWAAMLAENARQEHRIELDRPLKTLLVIAP